VCVCVINDGRLFDVLYYWSYNYWQTRSIARPFYFLLAIIATKVVFAKQLYVLFNAFQDCRAFFLRFLPRDAMQERHMLSHGVRLSASPLTSTLATSEMWCWSGGRRILKKKLYLCYSESVYYYTGAQRYEQFLQVGWLCRALILLGFALSSEHLCVFGLHCAFKNFCLQPSLNLLRSWAW